MKEDVTNGRHGSLEKPPKDSPRMRRFTMPSHKLDYSIHEVNSGAQFQGGLIIPRYVNDTPTDRKGVVFMYNPVKFTSKNIESASPDEPEVLGAGSKTLGIIAEVFAEAIKDQDTAVRVYNLTTESGGIRGDLWKEGKDDDPAILQRIKNDLLSKKDICLNHKERMAKWWIAWNLNETPGDWGPNLIDEERGFRSEKWDYIKTYLVDESKFYGFNSNITAIERTIESHDALEYGLFIHPSSISSTFKKRPDLIVNLKEIIPMLL